MTVATSDPTAVIIASAPEPPPSGDPPGDGTDCDILVFLDGVDVSSVSIEGSVTRRLNRPAQATIRIPMDSAIGGPGSRLQVWFDGTLFFHGMVMDCETDAGEDDGYTVYNAMDPMELWDHRVARDGPDSSDPGDFSNPLMFTGQDYDPVGPVILRNMLEQTIDDSDPAAGDGPIFLDLGNFPDDCTPLFAGPQDWPMTILEVMNLMVSSGEMDVVITPTNPGGGVMGTVDAYCGRYGTNHSTGVGGDGTVVFQYGMGNYTIRSLRWNEDMSNITNKLWYYGGPKIHTIADPDAIQHWCWNITGDDCCFTGVDNPPHCTCISPTQADMETAFAAVSACRGESPDPDPGTSRDVYGTRMEVQVFDAASDNCIGPDGFSVERDLYRWLWLAESWARCLPRSLVHITPIRGYPLGMFDIGDLVTVEATAAVRGGFSAAQRVYQYTVSWNEDGPCEISELQTSSDIGVGGA